MKTLAADIPERKRILKGICRKHKGWKFFAATEAVLFLAAAGFVAAVIVLLVNHPATVTGCFVFSCAGLVFACVPFVIALYVKKMGKYKCAFPYSSYVNGSLVLHGNALQYVFWRAGPKSGSAYSSKSPTNYQENAKYFYLIEKKDISSIEIKGGVCRIKGKGSLRAPAWAEEWERNELPPWAGNDGALKNAGKEFSFIMAFQEKNSAGAIKEWYGGK